MNLHVLGSTVDPDNLFDAFNRLVAKHRHCQRRMMEAKQSGDLHTAEYFQIKLRTYEEVLVLFTGINTVELRQQLIHKLYNPQNPKH